MYRHQEATGRKQPAWGGTDSWEEEVIEGDPCPLTVHRESLGSHSPKRHTTMLIPEVQTRVHKREEKKPRVPPPRTSALFGFSIWQKGSHSANLAELSGCLGKE